MAAAGGAENPDVNRPDSDPKPGTAAYALCQVKRELEEEPGTFDFFQAVRLIARLDADRKLPADRDFPRPENECVRFTVNPSLSFPPSQIHGIDWSKAIPTMSLNFMGLTGPMGTLPHAYSELIRDRLRTKDSTLRDFFDIFNHRAVSLFYQAWEKYRFPITYERDGADRVSDYLLCLIGLGTLGLQKRLEASGSDGEPGGVIDHALLFYTGLLGLQPHSAVALRNILEDYFGIQAEVEQFVGSWQELSPPDQCVFEDVEDFSQCLGLGAVAGDAVWDGQSRVRLKLGPLTREHYLSFLPSGSAWEPLRLIARFFCGLHVEVEVQLILKRDDVPRCELGDDSAGGPRLGWFTWMKSGSEFDRAPGDSILLIT